MIKSIFVDNVEYVPASNNIQNDDGLECCVIRTESAGVFYGFVKSVNGDVVELLNSRRIWRWYGAASLSQLAQEGVTKPEDCKIAMIEPIKTIKGWIEITPLTKDAKESLDGVEEWKM